jgi:HTH-type transcriptional repressor of NAD biosynthesis genes
MVKAFVFGKFLPFHKGHEAIIHFAKAKCDLLTVLVCASDRETIPAVTRKKWIENTFSGYRNVAVISFNYSESQLPNTSDSSLEVSKIWAEKFREFFPDYDLVFTSEEYGNYVASFMGIKHIAFDIPKKLFPVSSTAVRNNLFANWKFLPDSVKPHFAIKVVILGTESTGKSSLTEKLVRHYSCSGVAEAGRDLIADSNSFQFEDLHLVAKEHANRINHAVCGHHPLIIIDTDIHITMSYAQFIFGRELDTDEWIYNSNRAELYLYLKNDVAYIDDGTRLNEAERNLLDLSHRNVLRNHRIGFTEISGSWEMRLKQAVEEIDRILEIESGRNPE